MSEKYVVFDFETTGFSAQKNEIIQIGAVKYDENNQELARFNQLVKKPTFLCFDRNYPIDWYKTSGFIESTND